MKYQSNDFGGILLQLESGNIVVNGGGTLVEMEDSYIVDGKTPLAMIVTCEHHQRSHNADRFCLKYDVPLITTHLCAERLLLEGIKTHLLSVSESRLFVKYGFGISLIPVRYDSVDPFCLTVQDGENQIGVVPDGKIFPSMAKYLFDCDTVILENRLHIPDNASFSLARRLKSVYNTQSELDGIFKKYNGEIVYIMKEYCEKIALDAWLELSSSNLVTAEKLSKVPEIRFTNLGDKFLGRAYSDHIELNEKFLLEHQGKFADKCDLSTIPSDDWWRILLKQPQLAELCPAWDFRLDDWADLLKAQPHFFKRCGNICYLLLEYPDLYENWKLQDWAEHKIVAQSCTPLPPENHTPAEWYDIIMHDYRKCVLCDCLLELVLQYPEIFAQWCKFGTGSLYQPVFWQLTKA